MIVSSTPALNPILKEDEKDVAGTMGVFCLMAGLTLGSMASFGVGDAVRG
jgi:equilibrative nucleoside transporter 1/2/3